MARSKTPAAPPTTPPPTMLTLACETCGGAYEHPAAKRGRPPKHCPEHRKKGGPPRHPAENLQRRNARERTKTLAAKRLEVASDAHTVADLAAVMAVYPDPQQAATYLGLTLDDAALESLAGRAKRTHAAMVAGDPSALSPRVLMGLHLFLTAAIAQRHMISPRDLANVAGQFAKVHAALNLGQTARYTDVSISIVGSNGTAIGLGTGSGAALDEGPVTMCLGPGSVRDA